MACHRAPKVSAHTRCRKKHRSTQTQNTRRSRSAQTPKQHTKTRTMGRQTSHARTTTSASVWMDKATTSMGKRHPIKLRPRKHQNHTHQPTQQPIPLKNLRPPRDFFGKEHLNSPSTDKVKKPNTPMTSKRRKCAGYTARSGTPCRRQTAPTELYCLIHKRKK